MPHLVRCRIILSVARDLRSADMREILEPGETVASADTPTPVEIRAALDRIRKSAAIAGSEKLVQFLSFVVNTTLGGNASDLKEVIIGVSVFGRTPDYDPKTDTVVRSQAWRLRSKLYDYYQGDGAEDPVIIDIPRGSYVPFFYRRGHEPRRKPDMCV